MTTTTETVLSTPIVRKPAEENGEKPQQRSADWENPRVASILSAAAKCFARKGFTATTLAEIGKELGLRKSIVHYYFASKAALISLTKNLARALAPEARVNAVAPGFVDTEWTRAWPAARKQASIERTLLKRACTPDDIAAAIVFLCADTGMVTAQTLVVDGGYSL